MKVKTINITVGFEHEGRKYGWYKNKLLRLPEKKKDKIITYREMSIIKVGKQKGYNLFQHKLSMAQIEALNKPVDWTIDLVECKQCRQK